MRQKDDVSVAELLSQLREGTHTENDIEKKSAYNTTWWPKLSASYNHFFVATNDLLNSHNNAVFHSSPTVKALTSKMYRSNCRRYFWYWSQEENNTEIPNDPTKTMGFINEVS